VEAQHRAFVDQPQNTGARVASQSGGVVPYCPFHGIVGHLSQGMSDRAERQPLEAIAHAKDALQSVDQLEICRAGYPTM
jgi:hypothetical protein